MAAGDTQMPGWTDKQVAEDRARHEQMMALVERLSPVTRARLAQQLDDRFHEITGTPRGEEKS